MKTVSYMAVVGCLLLTACADFQPAKTGSVGGYQLQLKSDPAPLKVGSKASIEFSIRDGINQPVDSCTVRFRQYMPGHEMSLDNVLVLMIDEAKVGIYTADSGEFSMGGDWVLEFDFICGADHHTIPFDYTLEWPE
ncbi:MAG: FixH family protein [Gammaproteobacteria bacterium]|nr:FixH family protein [Gammaproteobacteria bacterium]